MDDNLMEARRWVKAERGLKKLPDADHSAVIARLAEMQATLEKQVAAAALPIVLEGNAVIVGTAGSNLKAGEPVKMADDGTYVPAIQVDDTEIAYKSKPRSPHHIPQLSLIHI